MNNAHTDSNSYNCPFGITNQKEIEKSNDRNAIMIENFDKAVKQLGVSVNEKFDELNVKMSDIAKKIDVRNDILENKIDKVDASIENRINLVVDNKFKLSVFNLVKWIASSVIIAIAVKTAVIYLFPIAT